MWPWKRPQCSCTFMGWFPRFIQGQNANSSLAHTTTPFPQACKSLPWLTRPELYVTSTVFKKIRWSFLRPLSETDSSHFPYEVEGHLAPTGSSCRCLPALYLDHLQTEWQHAVPTKHLKILSCCQEDLQICLTCTGKSRAEHSRLLKQSFGVWSGLHGADWYIEARVEERHWYMPRTTGQAGYGWAQLQPEASHPTQKTPKSSTIFLLNRLYEGWNFNSGNYLFTTDTK